MLFFGQRPGGIFGIDTCNIWLTYTNVEKIKVYYSSVHFFPKKIALSPDQWVVFDSQHCDPTTASWGGGRQQPGPGWLCRQSRWLWHSSEEQTLLKPTQLGVPWPIPGDGGYKKCSLPQQTARSYQAHLIHGQMRSLYHILGLIQIQRTLPCVFVCCSFTSWWSDIFLEFPEISLLPISLTVFSLTFMFA